MRLKRIITLGIAVAMTASVLAGCGNTEEQTGSSVASDKETSEQPSSSDTSDESTEGTEGIVFPLEETMEFTGLSVMANNHYYRDNTAWKAVLERANINIELTEIARPELVEKGNMIFAGGDYPDMLFKTSPLDQDSLGMEGLLIPLEDLIREYAPNLTALLDEREGWDDLQASDGHIYTFPNINTTFMQDFSSDCLWLNKRWMDNLGLQEPTNMEELYNVLKAFKEEDANGNGDPDDEIPFTFVTNLRVWLAYLDDGLAYANNYCMVQDGELVFYPLTDGFKENYLAYFAKMFDEGILDNNGFTQTQEQVDSLGSSADLYGMFRRSTTLYVMKEHQYDYIALKSFNGSDLPLESGVYKGGMAITDKCENPEVLVAWIDYLYSEEGGRLAYLGTEGVNYTVNADGTFSVIEDPQYEDRTYQCTLNGLTTTPAVMPQLALNPSPEGDPYTAYVYEEREQLYQGTIMPVLSFTDEENKKLSTLKADIFSYVDNYSAEVISGQKSLEDTWDEFQDTLLDMGAEELQSIYQAAYERGSAQ